LANYPQSVSIPNPSISQSILQEVDAERTCEQALIPDSYCHYKVEKKEACWVTGNDCELPAEQDRAEMIARVLRQPVDQPQHIHTVPTAHDLQSIRVAQCLVDAIVVLSTTGLLALLVAATCTYFASRRHDASPLVYSRYE
jgi:hypothetical protein